MWIWHELINYLAIVAVFVYAWQSMGNWMEDRSALVQRSVFFFATTFGAIAAILLSIRVPGGLALDARATFIVLHGFFAGPYSVLASGLIVAICQMILGGPEMPAGLVLIVSATLVGVGGGYLGKRFAEAKWQIVILSVAAAAASLLEIVVLPPETWIDVLVKYGPPIAASTFVSTLVFGLLILFRLETSIERRLMRTALLQSPDLQYIKDRRSRYVTANRQVAQYNGFADPADMRGLTDFDLTEPDHAKKLIEAEQRVMRTGIPMLNEEECVIDRTGEQHWFSTSKSAVLGGDGRVIGLAGVSREITEQKNMAAELVNSRNLLSCALTEMSDGLAMYDENGFLVLCNEQFRRGFPVTGALRIEGAHYKDILRAVAASGEELDLPPDMDDQQIEEVFTFLSDGKEHDITLLNGHTLKMRARSTSDGKTVFTVSDVTEMRNAQDALLRLNEQLRQLATTDGLTGLLNRRAFDGALADELNRSVRAKKPLSLLLVDVDHFKSYNDLYGHLAGDECLRKISSSLKRLARRPGDVAARFGGEEFVLILPDTDSDGAAIVAEALREDLADLALPHSGNVRPTVTVSIGIASCASGGCQKNPTEFIHRADTALYAAKRAGRDEVVVWNEALEQTDALAG